MERKREIGLEIKTLSNLIERKMHQVAHGPEGEGDEPACTKMQGMIIEYLYSNRAKGDLFQRDVEARFSLRRSTATGLLQLMEKRGFLEREPVSYDARLKKLVLTQKALNQRAQIREAIRNMEALLAKGLTQQEVDDFYRIIDKMKHNVLN